MLFPSSPEKLLLENPGYCCFNEVAASIKSWFTLGIFRRKIWNFKVSFCNIKPNSLQYEYFKYCFTKHLKKRHSSAVRGCNCFSSYFYFSTVFLWFCFYNWLLLGLISDTPHLIAEKHNDNAVLKDKLFAVKLWTVFFKYWKIYC